MTVIKSSGMTNVTPESDFAYGPQPDCSAIDAGPASAPFTSYDASRVEFLVEFKMGRGQDPFPKILPPHQRLMPLTASARDVIGQITAYATELLTSQYRTHAFTILICHDIARLIRWDCAGAIVTEPIYYNNDNYLHEFLIRYNDCSRETRGHDTTVTSPSPEEVQDARTFPELANETRLLAITIPDGSQRPGPPGSSRYIIPRPHARPILPIGRFTRASIAYDVERNKLVLLKDSWRLLIDSVTPEGEVYAKLSNGNVPNVPVCSLACDIGDASGNHRTQTDKLVGQFPNNDTSHFTPHQHYRLVLDTIGQKLEEFPNSRAMVKAVRAAVIGKCHRFCNVF
jgi:hypothetical protein